MTARSWVGVTAILCCVWWSTGAMPAFDCLHDDAKVMTLDLLEPANCSDPVRDYEAAISRHLQIIQTGTALPLEAVRCRVLVSREASYCGFSSILYASRWSDWRREIPIGAEDCRGALGEHGTWVKPKELGGHAIQLKKGRYRTDRWFSEGMAYSNGACRVADFWRNGRHYPSHYEQSMVDIEVEIVRGSWDAATDQVTFQDGMKAAAEDGVLRDPIEGTIVWELPDHNCPDVGSQLYYGEAEIHEQRGRSGQERFNGAIVLVTRGYGNRKTQVAGFSLGTKIKFCGAECLSTQIEGVVVCPQMSPGKPVPGLAFRPYIGAAIALVNSLQSSVGYAGFLTSLGTQERFQAMQNRLCQTERKTLFNRLHLISGNKNPYALMDLFGRGHTVYPTGSVARITKCVPIEVQHAHYHNCTEEMPVIYGEEIRFLDPISWVAKVDPTVIRCTAAMPTRWKLAGVWYCPDRITSDHIAVRQCTVENVRQLNATDKDNGPEGSFTRIGGTGIYSAEMMEEVREFKRQMDSREAVLRKATSAAIHNARAGRLGSTMDRADYEEVRRQLNDELMPLHWLLGERATTVFNIVIGMSTLALVVRVALHLTITYKQMGGCGCWIIIAVLEAVFGITLLPWQLIAIVTNTVYQDLHRVLHQVYLRAYFQPMFGARWKGWARLLRAWNQRGPRSSRDRRQDDDEADVEGDRYNERTGGQRGLRSGFHINGPTVPGSNDESQDSGETSDRAGRQAMLEVTERIRGPGKGARTSRSEGRRIHMGRRRTALLPMTPFLRHTMRNLRSNSNDDRMLTASDDKSKDYQYNPSE